MWFSRRSSLVAAVILCVLIVLPVSHGFDRSEHKAHSRTLEDIYGDSGDRFRGAIGIVNFEKTNANAPDPLTGYGIAVDDVKLEWREFNLVDDATDCVVVGDCATVDVQTSGFFEGNALVTITVLERSHTDSDCDCDGVSDVPFDIDCDGNGVDDGENKVAVKATSEAEVAGECVLLVATGVPDEFRGDVPISASYDVPGTLFIEQVGTDDPTVTVTYEDFDDGTGSLCRNDVDPAAQGRVQAATVVFLTGGNLVLTGVSLDDGTGAGTFGDVDGFADTNETVDMAITLKNNTGVPLSGVIARLATNDAKIDCILNSVIAVGDIDTDEIVTTTGKFRFRVADVDRTTSGLTDLDGFSAELNVILSGDDFDVATIPQSAVLDLDLDASGGSGPTSFFEGFEVDSGLGSFTTMNLDFGRHNLSDSDGWRCQYSDPDWINSNAYTSTPSTDCSLGANPSQADAYFWQVNGPTSPDGGRSFTGTRSLYLGIYGAAADENTTPLATLEAVRADAPINIGWDKVCETTRTVACTDANDCLSDCVANVCTLQGTACTAPADCPDEACDSVSPQVSWHQQVSLVDGRNVNAPLGETADRGVFQVQLADSGGAAVGDWIKLEPYLNSYDQQNTDNYTGCDMFDPVDDGTTEDDFFDPTDPDRRLGPSSTCFPEFIWAHQGDTDNPFSEGNIGRSPDGPGEQGATGVGTWVETRINLERFRGRRLRMRMVDAHIHVGGFETHEAIFMWNPIPTDDGWWIDDFTVRDTLTTAASISNDDKAAPFPDCGVACTPGMQTAVLTADPGTTLPSPGKVVELDASASTSDRCLDGVLQYRFSIDLNGNGTYEEGVDTLLRDWTDNASNIDAPSSTTRYVAEVRCSADQTNCTDTAALTVTVDCPGGLFEARYPGDLTTPDKDTLDLGANALLCDSILLATGGLDTLASYAQDNPNVPGGPIELARGTATFDITSHDPVPDMGFWYLAAEGDGNGGRYCNASYATTDQTCNGSVCNSGGQACTVDEDCPLSPAGRDLSLP